jgi:hypothetical protein
MEMFRTPGALSRGAYPMALRTKAAQRIIAVQPPARPPGAVDGSGYEAPDPTTALPPSLWLSTSHPAPPLTSAQQRLPPISVTFSDEAIRGSKFGAD